MLIQIVIKDLAIVDRLELALAPGMTVLTGETGAGKSILVDALGLALGDRAESHMVRPGSNRAEISVGFDVRTLPGTREWLAEQDLDEGPECLLRRTISADGRSRGFINGSPSPMQSLRALSELLVDIHGQHEHQYLLRPGTQRQLLDDFAAHDESLEAVRSAHGQWRAACREKEALARAAADREARLDLLRYQMTELDALDPREEELESLETEHARLANVTRLQEGGQSLLHALYEQDEGAASGLLMRCVQELEELKAFDERLGEMAHSLDSARIQVEEAAKELRRHLESIEADPERMQELDDRLAALHDVARKHRVSPEELPALRAHLAQELQALEDAETTLGRMQERIDEASESYRRAARRLSESRARAAQDLGARVTRHMQGLGMPGGRFEIGLSPLEDEAFSAYGMERVAFRVSANPGQPLRPLNKVASGGELSRIGLAIQVAAAHIARIPTVVFDEVDVGIGGGVAEIVGRELRTLGENRQVLCVTHLPQVAAQAHHHLHVSKEASEGEARVQVKALNATQRVEEIARMLGGLEITEQTRSHAQEMLARAQTEQVRQTKRGRKKKIAGDT